MSDIIFDRANPTFGELYVQALAATYRAGSTVFDPDAALRQDINIYEKMLKDTVIAHAIMQRKHRTSGRKWLFNAATDSEQDNLVKESFVILFKRIRRFQMARRNSQAAIIRGRTFGRIFGKRVLFQMPGDTKPRKWWFPTRIQDVDKRRFKQTVPLSKDEVDEGEKSNVPIEWMFFSQVIKWVLIIKFFREDIVIAIQSSQFLFIFFVINLRVS